MSHPGFPPAAGPSATTAAAPPPAPDAPVPKKRGRPPKPKPPVDPSLPPVVKRPRGRPPKPKPPVDESLPPTPKRPRGRPPKPKPPVDENAPPPTPKKRGRPPTNPATIAAHAAAAAAAAAALAAGDTPAQSSAPPTPSKPAIKATPAKSAPVKAAAPPKPTPVKTEPKTTPAKAAAASKAKAVPSGAPASATPKVVTTTPRAAPRSGRLSETLASLKKLTPRKHESPSTLPSFDEDVFGTPSAKASSSKSAAASVSMSREAFLANEALRRQREARNFTFEGDANAPRQTRSGRIVAREPEADEYGAAVTETDDTEAEADTELASEAEADTETDADTNDLYTAPITHRASAKANGAKHADGDVEMEDMTVAEVSPLPPTARLHILRILETLTGREREPAPLPDEDTNEALQGIVNLLRGTVERGEGNSALVTGPRGVGKTRTIERALRMLPASAAPIIVRLSGHAQTDDRLAIREMGRQIAAAEGKSLEDDNDDDEDAPEEYAPTTLPSHLLALLTAPSPRAIIVVIDEFDLFTEHARQALLYCLLDVVQSVQTGPVETTSRGMAVIGVTSRVDTLLLLEKRVKSRFSHRVWRVSSPLSPEGAGWKAVLRRALVPWTEADAAAEPDKAAQTWMEDWSFAVDTLLENKQLDNTLSRLAGLTTDVRLLFRPFVPAITSIISGSADFMSVPIISGAIKSQLELAGWGTGSAGVSKLRGLPHPALGVLIVAKHLAYAGRLEFSLAQVEDEYLRFARTRLVGSGRSRWPLEILRKGFDHCRTLGLLAPAGPLSAGRRFAKVRATLSPHEVVAFFRGEGGQILGPELGGWGKMSGGHA